MSNGTPHGRLGLPTALEAYVYLVAEGAGSSVERFEARGVFGGLEAGDRAALRHT